MSEPPHNTEPAAPAAPVNPAPLPKDRAKSGPGGCVAAIFFLFGLVMIVLSIVTLKDLSLNATLLGCLALSLTINICAGFCVRRRWWAVFLGLIVFVVECAIAAGLLLWGFMNLKHM